MSDVLKIKQLLDSSSLKETEKDDIYMALENHDEVRLIELFVNIYDPYVRKYAELEAIIRTTFDKTKSHLRDNSDDSKSSNILQK